MNAVMLTRVAGFAGASLLVVQGATMIYRYKNKRASPAFWLGLLTTLMGASGLVLVRLFFSENLIASPEYDLLLVRGQAARIALSLLVLALSVAAGLAWHAVRQVAAKNEGKNGAKQWPNRLVWLAGIGLAVGFLTSLQVTPLTEGGKDYVVYAYDLWSPFLIVWMTVFVSDAVLTAP